MLRALDRRSSGRIAGMGNPSLRLTGDPQADQLLANDDNALLIGVASSSDLPLISERRSVGVGQCNSILNFSSRAAVHVNGLEKGDKSCFHRRRHAGAEGAHMTVERGPLR